VNKVSPSPRLLDTSELVHGDKDKFRDYTGVDELGERVKKTYYEMHSSQTVEFVLRQQEKWLKFNHMEATGMEALEILNELVDESDPDLDLPNIVHAFQTAERIRELHPDKPWFHLVGLIHDMGKVMAFYGEPQWAVVGDTFVVGCKPGPSVVYGEASFKGNPDMLDPRYNTYYGQYEAGCGLDNLLVSWGHDEYLYQVILNHQLKNPQAEKIPQEGLWAIRYHSLYPWHTGGDYQHLTTSKDREMMQCVLEFNKFDLYTKSTVVPDIEKLKPYYQGLMERFLPGSIKF